MNCTSQKVSNRTRYCRKKVPWRLTNVIRVVVEGRREIGEGEYIPTEVYSLTIDP